MISKKIFSLLIAILILIQSTTGYANVIKSTGNKDSTDTKIQKESSKLISSEDTITGPIKVTFKNASDKSIVNVVDIDLYNVDRTADKFALYTPAYGDNTLTGAYGVDVVVINNVVKEVLKLPNGFSDGNTPIPSNGFVISVIDTSGKSALRDKLRGIPVGSIVEIEGITINYTTPQEIAMKLINKTKNIDISIREVNKNIDKNEAVIFTPTYEYRTTKRQGRPEIIVVEDKVESINLTGDSVIPLNGYVLSLNNYNQTFDIGDNVLTEGLVIDKATMAAYNQNGKRVIVDYKNTTRSKAMVVIYTDAFGQRTNTNQWGVEILVNEEGVVTHKRAVGEGNQDGSPIGKRGFVLSSYTEEYNEKLDIYNIGDNITLEGVTLVDLDTNVTFKYSAINPNETNNQLGMEEEGKPFPGYRGADQLLVYNSGYTSSTTGTNAYGSEIIVEGDFEDGKIVSIGGNNNIIPKNGYVLSGHGAGSTFLISNSKLNSKVVIDTDKQMVTIITTQDSILASAKLNISVAEQLKKDATKKLLDVNYIAINEALANAKLKYTNAKELSEKILLEQDKEVEQDMKFQFLDLVEEVNYNCDLVYFRTLESNKVEARGVWHRPTEKNLLDIQKNLQELADTNFNILFLETFYQGYTIYPSNIPLIKQNPLFATNNYGQYGNDLLKAYVEEGKKYGIEVHAWVEDFFVGEISMKPQSPILEQKPEWSLINYDGTNITKNEGGSYRFMDPAIPEVRELLISLYSEIVSEYNIYGLQLDYIRYPVSSYKNDTGYGEYSIAKFKKDNNIAENVDIKALMDNTKNPLTWESDWNLFKKWQENNITSFVENVVINLKEINKDLLISTAIFADRTEATEKKRQNWPLWVENGLIDITAPMAYYKDTYTVAQNVGNMVVNVDGQTLNYAGIAPSFIGLPARNNAEQTRATQLGKSQGSVIFASQFVLGLSDIQNVLVESTYRNEAILPHDDIKKVIDVALDDYVSKAKRLYVPNKKMTPAQLNHLILKINYIKNMPTSNSQDLYEVVNELDILIENISNYANEEAKNRLKENLDYLSNIVRIRGKRMSLIE